MPQQPSTTLHKHLLLTINREATKLFHRLSLRYNTGSRASPKITELMKIPCELLVFSWERIGIAQLKGQSFSDFHWKNLNSNIVVRWNYTIQFSFYWQWNLASGKWLHYSSVSYSLNKSSFVAQPRIWADQRLTPFAPRLGVGPTPSPEFKS